MACLVCFMLVFIQTKLQIPWPLSNQIFLNHSNQIVVVMQMDFPELLFSMLKLFLKVEKSTQQGNIYKPWPTSNY